MLIPTLTGAPLMKLTPPDTCQPLRSARAGQFLLRGRRPDRPEPRLAILSAAGGALRDGSFVLARQGGECRRVCLARLPLAGRESLAQSPEIYKLLENEFAKLQKDLPTYERVRKFTLLTAPLTVEEGEITPTLKVKRKVVQEKYKDLIDKMYAGAG